MMSIDKTIDFYNKNAENYCSKTIGIDLTQIYEKFLKYIPKQGAILDLGCGSGRDSLYFLNNGFDVTSMDASIEMVKLSSKLINQKTIHRKIEDIDFKDKFDGIWACASLLHINKNATVDVYNKLLSALKIEGILYASYKYGTNTMVKEGRYFNNYDENSFSEMIKNIKSLELIEFWTTLDLRQEGNNQKWLNILLKRIQ
tara:strand:- start:16 stop:615 length:600 start_codon:yes stop_codon:yes gene_type:complete